MLQKKFKTGVLLVSLGCSMTAMANMNSETDAVADVNTMVVGDAPAISMAGLYQSLSQSQQHIESLKSQYSEQDPAQQDLQQALNQVQAAKDSVKQILSQDNDD